MGAKAFNVTRVPSVLPSTTGSSFDRMAGLAVSLDDCGLVARGIVRCDQPSALDFQARVGKYLESVPERIILDVLAKLRTIFS